MSPRAHMSSGGAPRPADRARRSGAGVGRRVGRTAARPLWIALLALTAAFAVAVAGLIVAGSHQATLASAIRPVGGGLPPAEVLGSPSWTLSTSPIHEWSGAKISAPEVPVEIETAQTTEDDGDDGREGARSPGAGAASLTSATVHLSADTLRFDGGRVTAHDGSVSLEFGPQEIGTPFGLCAAHLTAYNNGSLVGGSEPRARLVGRILRPGLAGDPAAATTAGACGDDTGAYEVGLRAGGGAASAVIDGVDRSTAGSRETSGDPATIERPVGARVRLGAEAMPLGLAPTAIEARAHTVVVTATFDEVDFAPTELTRALTLSVGT